METNDFLPPAHQAYDMQQVEDHLKRPPNLRNIPHKTSITTTGLLKATLPLKEGKWSWSFHKLPRFSVFLSFFCQQVFGTVPVLLGWREMYGRWCCFGMAKARLKASSTDFKWLHCIWFELIRYIVYICLYYIWIYMIISYYIRSLLLLLQTRTLSFFPNPRYAEICSVQLPEDVLEDV